jgi:Protein of unknown function (DUF2924)
MPAGFVFSGAIIWAGRLPLPRWLLLRILAYRLQAAELGALDKATVRSIRASQGDAIEFCGSPFKTRSPRTRDGIGLNSGALLVREWKGKLERVMVLDEGFAWNGRIFGSLSQVAKAITGTSWNGHRFFGLRSTKDRGPGRPVARLTGAKGRGRRAARSQELGRTEFEANRPEGSRDIGRDETERTAPNAKRSSGHLMRRRISNPEPKPPAPANSEPRQNVAESSP